jgi:hypothetical protein
MNALHRDIVAWLTPLVGGIIQQGIDEITPAPDDVDWKLICAMATDDAIAADIVIRLGQRIRDQLGWDDYPATPVVH